MSGPVSRTVSIYIDQTAAQQSADRLAKTVERLTNTIKRGEAAGRDMSGQIANLGRAQSALNETNEIIAGRMTPSMRQLTQQASRLRNELSGMSRDNPGYAARLTQYRQVNQELERMQRDLRGVSEEMNRQPKSGGFWSQLKSGLIQGLGIGTGIAMVQKGISFLKDFATGAAEAASNMEQLRVSYSTLLGSKQAANDFIKDLQKFSANTPFEFNEVAEMSKQLLAFGFAQKEIIPTLDMLGNIASGVGKDKLPALILAFSQIRSNGKLMAQDLNQLINAGFNPLLIISEKTGRSMGDLRKDMEKGLITFDKVQDAFKSATSEGGRFYNLMQNQSMTTSGALSNLKDNWEAFKTSMGESTNGVLRTVYLALGGIVNTLKEWIAVDPSSEIKKEQAELNGLVYAIVGVNENESERLRIINQLVQKYPEWFGAIEKEKITNNELLGILDLINGAYAKRLLLMSRQKVAQDAADKATAAQDKLDQEIIKRGSVITSAVDNGIISKEEAKQIQEAGKISAELQRRIAEARKQNTININTHGGDDKGYVGGYNDKGAAAADLLSTFTQNGTIAKLQKEVADSYAEMGKQTEKTTKAQEEYDNYAKNQLDVINAEIANTKTTTERRKVLLAEKAALQSKIAADAKANATTKTTTSSATTLTSAQKKAKKDHDDAVKDVNDLQLQLQKLRDDINAAQVDADAGFEDSYNRQIQAISDKYDALIKKVKDRLADLAGLTSDQKKQLTLMIAGLENAETAEKGILEQKHIKEKREKWYKDDLNRSSDFYEQQRQLAGQAYTEGLTSYEDYQSKLLAIDSQEAIDRVEIATQYADYVKAAHEDLENVKTKAIEKGIKDRRTLEERARDEEKARLQLGFVLAKKGSKEEHLAKRAAITQDFEDRKKQFAENSTEWQLMDAQEKEALKAEDREYWRQKLQYIADVIGASANLINNFMSYLNQGDQNLLDQEQDRNDKKKKSYQKMLDNKQISQEQYQKMVNDSDAATERKEIEIKKRMAKREKAMAMFNAVIQTAQAVLQALAAAPPPWNIALAAISGAAGAIQVATIAKQKEPQFKDGGIFDTTGGIVKGASHSNGGISMIDSATGKKVGEMEGDEAYMILSKKATAANRDIIEKLLASSTSGDGQRIRPDWMFAPPEQINYEDAIETINYTRQYRNGGVTVPTTPVLKNAAPGTSSSDQKTLKDLTTVIEALNRRLDQPLKADVVWTDLNRKQKQYELLQKESSFNATG